MKQIEQQNKRVSPSPQKGAITERGLFRLMLPSLLGILLCSTCLAGLTWAYFSDSVTSSANTITAATFTVEVTITEITDGSSPTDPAGAGSAVSPTNEEGGTDIGTGTQQRVTITGKDSTSAAGTPEAGSVPKNEAAGEGTLAASSLPNMESKTDTPITTTAVERNTDDSYTLHAGKKYTVTLKASGNTKGYCKVTVNENDYYTEKMDPAQELQKLVFSIDCSSMTSETTVRITPGWVNSAYPTTEPNQIISDKTIVTPTTDDNTPKQILNKEAVQLKKQTPVEQTRGEPTPVEPTPVEPTPVEPTPVEPTPVEPTPVEPTPVEPTPVEPTPVEPTPVEPTPVEPTPVEPTPVEPTPAE